MEPKDYVLGRLSKLKEANMPARSFGTQEELVKFIYQALMSKKFRKYSVAPEYQQHIRSAIELNVRNNEPIKIALPFGGYKLWRLDEAPEVDWAELFSVIYYAYWLKPIFDNYKPGIWFDFYSDDIIVRTTNNIPREDTDRYCETFDKLLGFLRSYLPANARFTLNRVGEQYSSYEDFESELHKRMDELLKSNGGKFPTWSAKMATTFDLNVKPKADGNQDPEWREKTQLVYDAYHMVSKRRPYCRAPDKIVAFPSTLNNTIVVGSTKNSIVKFWVGVGVLKEAGGSFAESVLSPSQLASASFGWAPTSIEGLDGKNFRRVRITS